MTPAQLLLLPAFAHVLLILVVIGLTGRARVEAIRVGEARPGEVQNNNAKWPDRPRQLANNYSNQFELPVLFYALLGFLLVTGLTDAIEIVLAWAFVASRIVHSYIHTGSNHLLMRFRAFLAGMAILSAMWIWFGVRLYFIG